MLTYCTLNGWRLNRLGDDKKLDASSKDGDAVCAGVFQNVVASQRKVMSYLWYLWR